MNDQFDVGSLAEVGCSQINKLPRDQVECSLRFSGFLVFHCPLKPDAVEALQMLAESSHRVSAAL